EASTNLTLDSAIYAYSRSKGVFARIALDGAVLSLDDRANQKVYGADVDARALLNETGDVPKELEPFMNALRRTPAPERTTILPIRMDPVDMTKASLTHLCFRPCVVESCASPFGAS